MPQEEIRLCKELEVLFDYIEGRITLEKYHAKIKFLEAQREALLKKADMLSD